VGFTPPVQADDGINAANQAANAWEPQAATDQNPSSTGSPADEEAFDLDATRHRSLLDDFGTEETGQEPPRN